MSYHIISYTVDTVNVAMNPEKRTKKNKLLLYIILFNAVLTEAGDSALVLEQNPSSFSLPESSPSEVQI